MELKNLTAKAESARAKANGVIEGNKGIVFGLCAAAYLFALRRITKAANKIGNSGK